MAKNVILRHFEIDFYCLPWEQNLDGSWNGGIQAGNGGEERWRFDWMMGARFESNMYPDPYMVRLIALRRRLNQLLYAGTFQDTVGLTLTQGGKALANPAQTTDAGWESAPTAGPQAKWFLLGGTDEGAIVNVIQDPPVHGAPMPLTVGVPTTAFGPVRAAWALNLDGSMQRLCGTQSAGRYVFTLPGTQKAVSVLLVNSVGPQFTDLTLPFAGAPGATMTGQADVINYNPDPVRAALAWQMPGGWRGTAAAAMLPPGRTVAVPVSLTLPVTGLGRREDLMLTASAGKSAGTYPHWVTITDPLWVRLFRRPAGHVDATVFNRSDKPLHGTLAFTAPNGVTLSPAQMPFTVNPWSRMVLPTLLSGMEGQQTPIHMTASATAGEAVAKRTLMLYPPAVNGGFEADSAGDGRPDYWHSWGDDGGGMDTTDIDCGRLDTDHPYSGKFCLRLDPHPTAGRATFAEPFVRSIDVGQHYHLRAAVRKTDADDDIAITVSGHAPVNTPHTAGVWSVVDYDFTTGPDEGDTNIQFTNKSRHPVWFDTLTIDRVK